MTIPNSMNYSKTFNNYCQIALQKECTRLRIPTNSVRILLLSLTIYYENDMFILHLRKF